MGKQPEGCWGIRGVVKNFPSVELAAGCCGAGCTGETCFSCGMLNTSTFFPAEPEVLAGGAWVCAGQAGAPSSAAIGQQHLEGCSRVAPAKLHPRLFHITEGVSMAEGGFKQPV